MLIPWENSPGSAASFQPSPPRRCSAGDLPHAGPVRRPPACFSGKPRNWVTQTPAVCPRTARVIAGLYAVGSMGSDFFPTPGIPWHKCQYNFSPWDLNLHRCQTYAYTITVTYGSLSSPGGHIPGKWEILVSNREGKQSSAYESKWLHLLWRLGSWRSRSRRFRVWTRERRRHWSHSSASRQPVPRHSSARRWPSCSRGLQSHYTLPCNMAIITDQCF